MAVPGLLRQLRIGNAACRSELNGSLHEFFSFRAVA